MSDTSVVIPGASVASGKAKRALRAIFFESAAALCAACGHQARVRAPGDFSSRRRRGADGFPSPRASRSAGNDNFVQHEWERCKAWIEAALPYCYGTHRIEDVEQQIAEGRLQFWPGEHCAVVTEIIDYPRLRALNFFLVGGDLDELLEKMEPAIVDWAKSIGCTRVAQTGRRGWGRVLAPLGYETTLSVMLKPIEKDD
jgi:hypothetical protein